MSYPLLPAVTFKAQLHGAEITGDVVNVGEWFGRAYVIEIGIGFSALFFVVEADSEQNAIDEFADSRFSHLIDIAEDDMGDYDEDNVSRAGNDSHPIDMDHMMIYQMKSGLRYFAPYLWSAGVSPAEYSAMQSADKFDKVWGDEKQIDPKNMGCRYVDLLYPVVAPNAKDYHNVAQLVSYGDIVVYRDGDISYNNCETIGRIFGIMTRDGLGNAGDPNKPTMMVMQLSNDLTHCYVRSVALSSIVNVVRPSEFTRWFFGAQLGDSQSLLSYSRYGSLNERYLPKYLNERNELRPVRRPFYCVDISANAKEAS